MNRAKLMQRVMAVPLGHELRVSYGDMWRAAGDGEVASPEQVEAFVQQIARSWGVSVVNCASAGCYTLLRVQAKR